MKRTIYHGSENVIKKPEYSKGNIHNDYGLGFYCCSDKELAREWAARRNGSGYVNCYHIRDDRLKILDLTKPPYNNVLYWVALLMHNRELSTSLKENYPKELKYLEEKYLLDVSEFDIVIGYRADDSYFSYAQDFIEGGISCGQLAEAMRLGNLGLQYVLKSEKAFERLSFVESEEIPSKIWYPKRETRDHNARRDYYRMDIKKYIRGDLYMIQILDEEVKPGDLRIR